MTRKPKPSIALVLGSGAARGWAHIGVIHELKDLAAIQAQRGSSS